MNKTIEEIETEIKEIEMMLTFLKENLKKLLDKTKPPTPDNIFDYFCLSCKRVFTSHSLPDKCNYAQCPYCPQGVLVKAVICKKCRAIHDIPRFDKQKPCECGCHEWYTR